MILLGFIVEAGPAYGTVLIDDRGLLLIGWAFHYDKQSFSPL
jgi:hypothetical protein